MKSNDYLKCLFKSVKIADVLILSIISFQPVAL